MLCRFVINSVDTFRITKIPVTMLKKLGQFSLISFCVVLANGFNSFLQESVPSYQGHQVLRVNLATPHAFDHVKTLFASGRYEFWNSPYMGTNAFIMTTPQSAEALKSYLAIRRIPFEVMHSNLQISIDYERANHVDNRKTMQMTWTRYHTIETIHGFVEQMALKYPDLVTVINYGNSTEGRPMKLMKLSTEGPESTRPAIWIDGGIHAREWISPATVTYMAKEILLQTEHNNGSKLLDNFDFYILPVMNPDGYAHTMKPVGAVRLWRKTRSENRRNKRCRGVDPNRNWDYKWGGKGTSSDPCSEFYRGERAASEPEISSSQDFILKIKDSLKLFLTFHSYTQLLLLPWSHDTKQRSSDYQELLAVGKKALSALEKVHRTKYRAGASADVLYAFSGGSFDWAKAVAGVKYSYLFELRDTGRHGFLLPPNQIIPSGRETFEALKSMVEDMTRIYIEVNNTKSYK